MPVALEGEDFGETGLVGHTRDLDDPEPFQVRRRHLGIEETEAAPAKTVHEMHQRHLRGVAHTVEHRLPEKGPAEPHAIESADEVAVLPAFHAVRMPPVVEPAVGVHQLLRDPRRFPSGGRLGAGAHDRLEGGIDANLKPRLPNDTGQRTRHVEGIEREDGARIRGVPVDLAVFLGIGHRKETVAVRVEKEVGRERLHEAEESGDAWKIGDDRDNRQARRPIFPRFTRSPMPLQVRHADQTFDLDQTPDGLTLDGTAIEARLERLDDHTVLLVLNGRTHVLTVEPGTGSTTRITVQGHALDLDVKDETALLLERFGFDDGSAAAEREVRAPMPGLVLRVLVEPGQTVQEGDGLVVLEAMKMENELRAPASGTVAAVHVQNGAAVGKNDLLVEVE